MSNDKEYANSLDMMKYFSQNFSLAGSDKNLSNEMSEVRIAVTFHNFDRHTTGTRSE